MANSSPLLKQGAFFALVGDRLFGKAHRNSHSTAPVRGPSARRRRAARAPHPEAALAFREPGAAHTQCPHTLRNRNASAGCGGQRWRARRRSGEDAVVPAGSFLTPSVSRRRGTAGPPRGWFGCPQRRRPPRRGGAPSAEERPAAGPGPGAPVGAEAARAAGGRSRARRRRALAAQRTAPGAGPRARRRQGPRTRGGDDREPTSA
jgi:hypothetical protein